MISRSTDYFITCYTVLTRPNKVQTAVHVAIVGFQFGLYHIVVPLSFLRGISLTSLFSNYLHIGRGCITRGKAREDEANTVLPIKVCHLK